MLVCRTKCNSVFNIMLEEVSNEQRKTKKNSLTEQEYSKARMEQVIAPNMHSEEQVKRVTYIPGL